MKTVLASLALLVLPLAACGSERRRHRPADSGGSSTRDADRGPAAPGRVRTADLVTVMDTGSPELCLGPVAESCPPQCSGPAIVGWSWADHEGTFETQQGDVRWGSYAVTGTWDGEVFTVTEAIPGRPLRPDAAARADVPDPGDRVLRRRARGDRRRRSGSCPAPRASTPTAGHVLVDVIYDDGSLQAWVDDEYGAGVVVVITSRSSTPEGHPLGVSHPPGTAPAGMTHAGRRRRLRAVPRRTDDRRSPRDAGGVNRFSHNREPAAVDKQTVIRMNRDTLYSFAVVDISAGATVTVPDAGERYLSVMIVNEDHYINRVFHDAGRYELTVEALGSPYVVVAARTPGRPARTQTTCVAVAARPGPARHRAPASDRPFELPDYETGSLDRTRTPCWAWPPT